MDNTELKNGYVPLAPLEAIAKAAAARSESPWNNEVFATSVGVSVRTIARWRAGGRQITWAQADDCAVHFGLHPMNIWGDDWLRLDRSVVEGTASPKIVAAIEKAMDAIGDKLEADKTQKVS
jgi:hypothetical protein